MKKVYQTIIDPKHGNCMQCAIASLFELSLEEVPHFLEFDNKEGTSAYNELWRFLKAKGYDYCNFNPFGGTRRDKSKEEAVRLTKEILKFDKGINGYFYASVPSQTYPDVYHAVIIDMDMNIVHDPNPNQLALKLGPKSIFSIITNNKNWHIDVEGKLVKEDES